MLTREHAIAEYDFKAGRVFPDRLTQTEHAQYRAYAERMLNVYRTGIGQTRRELHRSVHGIFAAEEDCPVRRIEAFCKLLDDASVYQKDRRGEAARLRRRVFHLAAPLHPLVTQPDQLFEQAESKVKIEIAAKLGKSWAEIDNSLFADIIEFHRLESFVGYPDGSALLARYNVAQVQVALYDAEEVTVWAGSDFKTVLRYAKLSRLMHTIQRAGADRYRIHLDGPASVLRQTRRYGVQIAKFLPALIACRDWRLQARLRTRRRGSTVRLNLSPDDRLNSHLPAPDEFDSQVEASFADKWGEDKRDGWRLTREDAILYDRQKVFVPDFVFRHDDGRTILFEIVGFWTPEYLQAKRDTLCLFREAPILLAIPDSLQHRLPDLSFPVVHYKTALRLQDVLAALDAFPRQE